MLSYKFKIYPSKTAQQKLNENLELSYDDPYRDYISAFRINMRGRGS
jgi:hypothetical protein